MNAVEIIVKKRDGEPLSREEINFFIDGYTAGKIPDYQASALAMAILCRGMNDRETADLTMAIAESGEILSLDGVVDVAVKYHEVDNI